MQIFWKEDGFLATQEELVYAADIEGEAVEAYDLAVAKKAYALIWQYSEQFSKVIVRMDVFHTICSLFV